jgi:ribulose-5-phosphate 4-epimerase/fuculose-1-phosphate aldolase
MLKAVTKADVRAQVSDAEWQARIELAALYRAVHRYGLIDLIYNHITLKVPGTDDQFLVNPYGLSYDEITASSLMTIDSAGQILLQPDHGYGINYTGFVIHGAIHAARPEIHCVAHTHTRAGIAVSAMQCGVLPLSQSAMRFHGTIGYHAFEGFAVDLAEQARLVEDLGEHDTMILRNHGLLACGRTVAQAFVNLHQLEMVCRAQVDVLASGAAITPIGEEAIRASRAVLDRLRHSGNEGRLEWAAQLRWLERNQPDYRD